MANDPLGVPDPPELTRPAPAKAPAAAPSAASSAACGWLRIREALPSWQVWVLGALPILLIFGVWFFLTSGPTAEERIVSPVILPSPGEVVKSVPALWFERELTRQTGRSFLRVLKGFLVAVAIAFPLGLLMGSFTKIKALFNPLAVFSAYLPIPALLPLTLSLFGTGETQKVAYLALAFLIFLVPMIVKAVDNVDDVYLKTAYTLGASKTQMVSKVLLGVAWPEIFHAMRLGFGVGWSYIILAEMVDIGKGLGGVIMISQRQGPREHIYLVLLVIVALTFVTDRLWAFAEEKLFPYREATR